MLAFMQAMGSRPLSRTEITMDMPYLMSGSCFHQSSFTISFERARAALSTGFVFPCNSRYIQKWYLFCQIECGLPPLGYRSKSHYSWHLGFISCLHFTGDCPYLSTYLETRYHPHSMNGVGVTAIGAVNGLLGVLFDVEMFPQARGSKPV